MATLEANGGKQLLTIGEVAATLSLSRRTVYRLIDEGRLSRVYPRPHAPRVTAVSLQAYLERLGQEKRPGPDTKQKAFRLKSLRARLGLGSD